MSALHFGLGTGCWTGLNVELTSPILQSSFFPSITSPILEYCMSFVGLKLSNQDQATSKFDDLIGQNDRPIRNELKTDLKEHRVQLIQF